MAQQVRNDGILFGVTLGLVVGGLLMVASSSSFVAQAWYGSGWHFALRQVIWAVVAVAALMFLKKRDYRKFDSSPWATAAWPPSFSR